MAGVAQQVGHLANWQVALQKQLLGTVPQPLLADLAKRRPCLHEVPVHGARCHAEPLRNRTFLGATREQTVGNALTHSLHNARLRLHAPNQRGGMGLELIDKLGCLFG